MSTKIGALDHEIGIMNDKKTLSVFCYVLLHDIITAGQDLP